MDADAAKDLYFALWAFLIYGFYGVLVEMTFCYAKRYKGVIESRCGLQLVAYLKARRDGAPLPPIDTALGRLVDRLVPDAVMINTFPRMSHFVEYMELTGELRLLIVADLHLGTPSDRHLRHKAAWPAPRPPKASPADGAPASATKQPCDDGAPATDTWGILRTD
ncbi:MAG TPA: hypothetical protein VIT41_10440 [Microlunatus sp.]